MKNIEIVQNGEEKKRMKRIKERKQIMRGVERDKKEERKMGC
jgi:hypothetical protein